MVLDLGEDSLAGVFATGHEVQGADSLSVQTHVLGEGLGDYHLEPLLQEVPDRPGVFLEVSSGESLVGGVEEGNEVVLLHDVGNLFPLLLSWVDSSGVVSAGVKQDH